MELQERCSALKFHHEFFPSLNGMSTYILCSQVNCLLQTWFVFKEYMVRVQRNEIHRLRGASFSYSVYAISQTSRPIPYSLLHVRESVVLGPNKFLGTFPTYM